MRVADIFRLYAREWRPPIGALALGSPAVLRSATGANATAQISATCRDRTCARVGPLGLRSSVDDDPSSGRSSRPAEPATP